MTAWSKQYGPVYKVGLLNEYVIVVSGYEAIYDCYLKKGTSTAGRVANFRVKHHFKGTGLTQTYPDETWKLTRKIIHQYMKQFGEGLESIERVIAEISRDMLTEFAKAADTSAEFDPTGIIKDTALRIIAFIVCGERLREEEPLFRALSEYEPLVWQMLDHSLDYLVLDTFPFLLNLPLRSSSLIKRADELRDDVFEKLRVHAMARDPEETLMGWLFRHTKDQVDADSGATVFLNDNDVLLSTANILFSGRATSSLSFSCLLNALAHHKAVQDRLAGEIRAVCPTPDEDVTLEHRPRLPYTRAVMLELFRYHTPVPLGGPRKTTCPTDILGTALPEGLTVLPNLWGLHHDEEFWRDPEAFRPERFLDNQGELVPPDNEKRKRVMAFAAGVRVCIAEQFAVTRQFLWVTNVFKRFEVLPARGKLPSSADARNFSNYYPMYIPHFKLLVKHRM